MMDFFNTGVAFLPSNEPNIGDTLMIYCNDGEREMLSMSVRGYLNQLTRFFGVDVAQLRARYGQAISKKQMVPLPLAPDWSLVPLQVRVPIGSQTSYGWVVMQAIEQIVPKSKGERDGSKEITLLLKGSHRIKVLHSEEDMRRILREVQLVELHYQLLHQTPEWVKESKGKYYYFL